MTVDALQDRGVIAVVRAPNASDAVSAGRAIAAGGVTAIEVTFTVPGAEDAIRELCADPRLLVGAGTVIDAAQAERAATAGAAYLVSPHYDPALVAEAERLGVPAIPGVLTPTEVVIAARRCGTVKLFPASLGGPPFLRAVRAPLPGVRFIPTGGVSPANLADWLAAGAHAVGVGSGLCPAAAVAAGDWTEIERRSEAYMTAFQEAKGQ